VCLVGRRTHTKGRTHRHDLERSSSRLDCLEHLSRVKAEVYRKACLQCCSVLEIGMLGDELADHGWRVAVVEAEICAGHVYTVVVP